MLPTELLSATSIWINANLITMADDAGYGLIENAVIACLNSQICFIGRLTDEQIAELTASNNNFNDANGIYITPGLIDCHTHMVFGGSRADEFEQRLKGASYEEIALRGGGILSTVNATRTATKSDLFESASKRISSLVNEGVTTLEIKSGYGLDTEHEIKMLEVVKQLSEQLSVDIEPTFLGAHALPAEYKEDADGYIDLVCDEMLPAIAKRKLATAVDAFCESIGFSTEQTERVFQAAQNFGLNIKLHAEQLTDQQGTQLACKYNALSADHLEYVSEDGVKQMTKSGTVAVLLPAAFYFLRETQLPPIDLFRSNNVPIALATDANPGSSPCFSLLLVMNMACTIFRMTPEESLRGVTINAAKALDKVETIGSLEVGKQADFVLWDVNSPAELAYQMGINPCKTVVKSGQVIVSNL
ncbi:MAG: imidazolonepropionase [Kangiellaceae bacterium]|jgi:imidazolonepropionase|nr:imidazolonepropionase [Kangiellaceae bacterium]